MVNYSICIINIYVTNIFLILFLIMLIYDQFYYYYQIYIYTKTIFNTNDVFIKIITINDNY